MAGAAVDAGDGGAGAVDGAGQETPVDPFRVDIDGRQLRRVAPGEVQPGECERREEESTIDVLFNAFSGLDGGFFFVSGSGGGTFTLLDITDEDTLTITATQVPEPTTLLLLGLGLLGLSARRKSR